VDDVRRTTYAPTDSQWTKPGEQFARKIVAKIPGLSTVLEPYINMWGEEEQQTENWAMRFIENAVLPWYGSEVDNADHVNMELERLFNKTDDTGVLPNYPSNYYNGEYVQSKEIDNYRINYGRTARKALEELIDLPQYDELSDDEKVAVVKSVYNYARAYARSKSSLPYKMDDAMTEVQNATKKGIGVEDFYTIHKTAQNIGQERRAKKEGLPINEAGTSVSQDDAERAINERYGATTKQNREWKAYMWWSFDKGWKPRNNPYIKNYKP